PAMRRLVFHRRTMLQALGALAAGAPLVGGSGDESVHPAPGPFLGPSDRETLDAIADAIPPPDADPGGAALGVSDYVENLLTALDGDDVPRWFAGGPFSGRAPFATDDGKRSDQFPDNEFANFVALDRVAELALRIYLFGSKGVS